MKKAKFLICSQCGEKFEAQFGIKKRNAAYCGYCAAVVLGQPNEDWLPKVKDKEDIAYLRKRGFHKT